METCCVCWEKDEKDNLIEFEEEKFCHKNCQDQLTECNECGKLFSNDELRNTEDGDYCNDCFDRLFCYCDDCNSPVKIENSLTTNGGRVICVQCCNEYYFVCNRCGEIFEYDEACTKYYKRFCNSCYDDLLDEIGVHEYGYKPFINFIEEDGESSSRLKNLHIGIELEIQGTNSEEFSRTFSSYFDEEESFYMKEDGSLDEYGVEIVSQPMTYKHIINGYDWERCFYLLNKYEMNNIEHCGLHFHLDREYFDYSTDNVAVIDFIVNTFSTYFEKLGGRPFNNYCRKHDKDVEDWGKSYTRYSAVNMENKDTVELRFCASTCIYETFIERVKMIFAIAYFAKKYTLEECMKFSSEDFQNKFSTIYEENFGSTLNI